MAGVPGVTTVADTGDRVPQCRRFTSWAEAGSPTRRYSVPHPDRLPLNSRVSSVRLDALRRYATGRVRLGVSPHAPYSVSGPLYAMVAQLARERSYPIAVHIAESSAESDLLGDASGGFAEAWRGRGRFRSLRCPVVPRSRGSRNMVSSVPTRCASMSFMPATATWRSWSVAPRPLRTVPAPTTGTDTEAAPVRSMLDRGIQGRDRHRLGGQRCALRPSRRSASGGQPGGFEGPMGVLRLCTLDGARALGLESEIGSLTAGKWGDLVAFRLPGPVDGARLADTVVTRRSGDVVATILAGRQVWRSTLMKLQRHAAILRIVRDRRVENQDVLREASGGLRGSTSPRLRFPATFVSWVWPSWSIRRAAPSMPIQTRARCGLTWDRFFLR